MILTTTSCC